MSYKEKRIERDEDTGDSFEEEFEERKEERSESDWGRVERIEGELRGIKCLLYSFFHSYLFLIVTIRALVL